MLTITKINPVGPEEAAILALNALAWVMSDAARAQRFLDLTGMTPDGLRETMVAASTQRAVLEFLQAHEPDLIAAAGALEVDPALLMIALGRLET